MKRALGIGGLLLLVAIAFATYRVLTRSGMFFQVRPHFPGTCRTVGGVVGAEDVTIDPETRIAYLSADDRRATLAGRAKRGEIYGLDLRRPDAEPVPLTGGKPEQFHPHGISLWRGPRGEQRLFAINHLDPHRHHVEVFNVLGERLIHVQSITYRELSSPNDLVAVAADEFYATNDRYYVDPGLGQTLEAYLQLPWASVSHFSQGRSRLVLNKLAFANGINVSADGGTIFVAECLGRAIHVYDRHSGTGNLLWRATIPLSSCPDNIEVDRDGSLWVAAHPRLFDLLAHSADPERLAPSQILHIDPRTHAVEEVLLDDGKLLSAASTAAVVDKTMVVGAIFDPKILVCELPR